MRVNLSEDTVRELASNLQKLAQQENKLMSQSKTFQDLHFHNGRSSAFQDAAGVLLMALTVERMHQSRKN